MKSLQIQILMTDPKHCRDQSGLCPTQQLYYGFNTVSGHSLS